MAPISSKPSQFGSPQPLKPAGEGSSDFHCSQCEAMLADVLDATLSETEQATFDLHLVGCPACSSMLSDAKRGHAWLEMLRNPRPEPPATLIDRILLNTSGIQSTGLGSTQSLAGTLVASGTPVPSPFLVSGAATPLPRNILPFRTRAVVAFRHTVMQPRLAMTAAMAFFSVALTLNLTGIHLTQLRASDLRPSSLRRDFYEANARAVRTFDNLRVVYELESRVHDLQRASDNEAPAQNETVPDSAKPASQSQPGEAKPNGESGTQPQSDQSPGQKPDQKQARPKPGAGTSLRSAPATEKRYLGSNPRHIPTGNSVILSAFLPNVKSTSSEGGVA